MADIHDYDFCSEMCEIYKKNVMRLEEYNIKGLVEQERLKINPYCREHCTHREEFIEWLKKRQAAIKSP